MRLKILAALAIVLGVAAYAGFRHVQSYVREDPAFCASCHRQSPEFALWSGGQHGRVQCQACHHSSPEQSVAMLGAFLQGRKPGGGNHGSLEIGACASCHLTHDKEWITVGASRGHRVHAVEQKISCVKCHGGGVHRFEPAAASCKTCHADHAVKLPGMQQLHCFACHDFLSVETTLRPTRRDCLRCHRAEGLHPSRFPEDGPMRFACSNCHKPHKAELIRCQTCHTALAGLHLKPQHRECGQCHRPHVWKSECADCQRCHHGPEALTCSSDQPWRAPKAPPTARRGN